MQNYIYRKPLDHCLRNPLGNPRGVETRNAVLSYKQNSMNFKLQKAPGLIFYLSRENKRIILRLTKFAMP